MAGIGGKCLLHVNLENFILEKAISGFKRSCLKFQISDERGRFSELFSE